MGGGYDKAQRENCTFKGPRLFVNAMWSSGYGSGHVRNRIEYLQLEQLPGP